MARKYFFTKGLRRSRSYGRRAGPIVLLSVVLAGCGSSTPQGKAGPEQTPYRSDYGSGPERAGAGTRPSDRDVSAIREQARGVFDVASAPGSARGEPVASDAWQIVIAGYSGPRAQEQAAAIAAQARQLGVAGARAEAREKGWVVATGRYAGLTGEAKADLARLKEMVVEGERPFAGAVLAPPEPRHIAGSVPEYDLAAVKAREGRRAVYSLQVAIYKRLDARDPSASDLAEFRKAAEEAVNRLRREGQEAYYYHAPRSSIVTVGVFSHEEYSTTRRLPGGAVVGGSARESMRVVEAREKNPYNLVNGQAVKVRGKLQPSMLVEIPG